MGERKPANGFRPSRDLNRWIADVCLIVGDVMGVPPFACVFGSKTKLHTPAKIVFREVLRRATGLSAVSMSVLIGCNRTHWCSGQWLHHEENIRRVLSLIPPCPENKASTRDDRRCAECGALRPINL